MPALAPFGFQASNPRPTVNEYYVPASDTSAYAIGDPVRTNGNVFAGRLSDSRQSLGMLHVTKAAPGTAVRGVVVGIAPGPGDNSAQGVPATKARAYTLLINDSPQATWEVQADNTTLLTAMAGMYASYSTASPLGSVSSTRVLASSIRATSSDLLITEVVRNDGANSLLRVAFVQHEMLAGGSTPAQVALTQALVAPPGNVANLLAPGLLSGVIYDAGNRAVQWTIDGVTYSASYSSAGITVAGTDGKITNISVDPAQRITAVAPA